MSVHMTGICRLSIVLSVTVLLFGSDLTEANRAIPREPVAVRVIPQDPWGGAAAAKSHCRNVRLESENVTIRLADNGYGVDAVFNFMNTGKPETVFVGFPKQTTTGKNKEQAEFRAFNAQVQGRDASFSEEFGLWARTKGLISRLFGHPSQDGVRWLVRQVYFPGHMPTTISADYGAAYYDSKDGRQACYLIGYSSSWKDNVRKTVLTIDGAEIGGTKNFEVSVPNPYTPKLTTENVVTFEIDDWKPEPQHQLRVVVKPGKPEKRLELYGKPEPKASK